MGKLQNGTMALVLGAALLSGGTLGASAQDHEASNETEAPVAAGTLSR